MAIQTLQANSLNVIQSPHFTISGGGSAITTGYKEGIIEFNYSGVILGGHLYSCDADITAGAIVLYVYKGSYSDHPPTTAIHGTHPPTIAATNTKGTLDVSDWTTAVASGDTWRIYVYSVTSLKAVTLVVNVQRT